MPRAGAALAALLAGPASAGRLHVITKDYRTFSHGTVDPATGEEGSFNTIEFPQTACGGDGENGTWVIGNGTQGQTATVFYQNGSMFFVAQEMCNGEVRQTSLMQNAWQTLRHLASLDDIANNVPGGAAGAMEQLHVEWDWTCNVIVTAPAKANDTATVFKRVEVSAYDGQVRALPDGGTEPARCGYNDGCWLRRTGLGGMSTNRGYSELELRTREEGGRPREDNCGVRCTSYVSEEWWEQGEATHQRRIVGRGVHNSSVVQNVTDPTRLLTMSWLTPSYNDKNSRGIFIGLGVCCDVDGCPQQCEGHGGKLALVEYDGGGLWPRVITPIDNSTGDDPLAAQMGVAIDPQYPVSPSEYAPRVSVWVAGRILSYKVIWGEYGDISVELIARSPKDPLMLAKPLLWNYLQM